MKKEFVSVSREELLKTVRDLAGVTSPERVRLSVISGADLGTALEVLYHFDAGDRLLTLRVQLKKNDAKIPSISHLFPAALLYEREFAEMFGIEVTSHPSPGKLFLPENYAGAAPLLKTTSGGTRD